MKAIEETDSNYQLSPDGENSFQALKALFPNNKDLLIETRTRGAETAKGME